jgi:hypothetical protein
MHMTATKTTEAGDDTAATVPMFDFELTSVGGATAAVLDEVRRNVTRTAAVLGRMTGAAFRCGCHLGLAPPRGSVDSWRIIGWNDARCASPAHRAVKAKWEVRNLT